MKGLLYFAQDAQGVALDVSVCNICTRFVQDSLPMCNICARFAQDCTYFPNVQYMLKICARLYLFPQCTIYVQDLHKIVLLSPMRKYVEDLCKIVLISPMRNMCTRFVQDWTYFSNAQYTGNICVRFAQDCTSFPNVQYMRKICTRLYLFFQCAIYAQDLHKTACIYGCRILSFRAWREITQICNFAHVKKLSFRAITQICNFAHFENKQNMYTE